MIACNTKQSTQTDAIDSPQQNSLTLIQGRAGSGKTRTLLARARRIAASLTGERHVLVSAPSGAALASLRLACRASNTMNAALRLLSDVAFDVIAAHTDAGERKPHLVDDIRAAFLFERCADGLCALAWEEFAKVEIDPEVAGLRSPNRFIATAYRLIRKLRAAHIAPAEFEMLCERGTATFYEKPPDLSHPDITTRTPANHRNSLLVDRSELIRQRRHEIELTKILLRLYVRYDEMKIRARQYTPSDALSEASRLLIARGDVREALKNRYPYACIDDAQDLGPSELSFLQALYGQALDGVTFAGDATEATRIFAGSRGERNFASATIRFTLEEQHCCPPAIANAARRVIDPSAPAGTPQSSAYRESITLHRAKTAEDEAAYVAAGVADLIAGGTPPAGIAVITRSIRGSGIYVNALLQRGVPLDIGGDASLYEFSAVLDALSALWAVADPYRHDWLLRTLQAPWVALSDASIAMLCDEPRDKQEALFDLEDTDEENLRQTRRRRQDLRLGRNVTSGDRDADLPPRALEHLLAFREALRRWESLERKLDVGSLARLILAETMLADIRNDNFEAGLIARLIEAIDDFIKHEPLGSLRDFLEYAERITQADEDLPHMEQRSYDAVSFLNVEAAKGRAFNHVFLIDARAGAFPRYYAPDAFSFYPSLGMIPKENVGEGARSARTAKFTYALHAFKTRERYVDEERRAFAYAMTRARTHLWVSASGRATRGNAAPEFLEELLRL